MKGYKNVVLAGVAALAFSGVSHAAEYTVNGNGPYPLTDEIIDTFSGSATLSRSCLGIPINLNCTLTLDGEIVEVGSNVNLKITDAVSSGGTGIIINCDDVSFSNFPWTGSTPVTNLPVSFSDPTPVPFVVSGIQVDTICGSCSGSVTASYSNTGNGEFAFAGSMGACSVDGNNLDSTTGNVYRVRQ